MDMSLEEQNRMLKTFRGRRFIACRAADLLRDVIRELPEGPYSQMQDGHNVRQEGLPGSTLHQKAELENMANLLLRMILTANDGSISPSKLNSF